MRMTLTGANSFLLQDALSELMTGFVHEHSDLALERIDGEEVDFGRIQDALTSLPFLASKKMVVLRAGSANKKFVERAEDLLGDMPDTTDLLLVEPKLDKRSSYYKLLKRITDFREYNEPDQAGLAQWLSETAKAQQGVLRPADARYLIERVGDSQQKLASELTKLLLYDPNITRATIDLLTEAIPQSTIFQLLEAAFGGKQQQTLTLYQEQRALKVEPPQIIAMLAWQLHILAIVKAAGTNTAAVIARDARLSPYVVGKSQTIARHLTLAHLKQLIHDLLEIDERIKHESVDADELLMYYLLQLAQAG